MARARARLTIPVGAEVSIIRLLRRLWRRALAVAEAELHRTWPRVDLPGIAAAIRREVLRGGEYRQALVRIARSLDRSLRRQLRLLGVPLPAPDAGVEPMWMAWTLDVERSLADILVGSRADTAAVRATWEGRADGALDLLTVLSRVVGAVAEAGGTATEAAAELRAAAGRAVRGATTRARAAVLGLGSRVNRRLQRAAGVTEYIWRTRRDWRVRPDHQDLDDTIQDWAHPPVVDMRTGRRAHPGEDFLCRCVAIPVL